MNCVRQHAKTGHFLLKLELFLMIEHVCVFSVDLMYNASFYATANLKLFIMLKAIVLDFSQNKEKNTVKS